MATNPAPARKCLSLAALTLPTLLISIDTSVLYLALPKLSADLKANSAQQLWIIDIYGFMLAGFLITMGNLGDRFGYRRLLMIGAGAFGLASLVAAYSPNPGTLILARALMGVAGATLMPSTLAIIRNLFTEQKQRNTAISIWMSCFMAGMVIGPLIGGIMLEYFWWGAVFLVSLPVTIIVVGFGKMLLPEYIHGSSKPLDIAGLAYSLLAVIPLIYGLTEFSRNDFRPLSIAALLTGLTAGFIFLQRQKVIHNPLLDISLFKHKNIRLILSAMTLTAVMMGGVALFIAQYLQLVAGLSPFHAGLWMIPQAVGMIAGSLLVPVIAKQIKPGIVISGGFMLTSLGMLLLTLVPVQHGLAFVISGFITAIIGVSPMLVLGTGMVIAAAPASKAGSASAIAETANQLGVALGVAVLGSIGVMAYRIKISVKYPFAVIPDNITGAFTLGAKLSPLDRVQLIEAARAAFLSSLHTVTLISLIAFAFLAALVAFLLKTKP